jgi:hypothetical protein
MSAPKGNNYWEFRNKHGRDFKYTPDYLWDEAVKYFEWISTKVWNKKDPIKSGEMAGTLIDIPTQTPMSLESFCLFADISCDTFRNYESNTNEYKDYFEVTTRIRKIIESQQFEGATVGAFNPNIIARKLGLQDKTDITSGGEKIEPPKTTIINLGSGVKPK